MANFDTEREGQFEFYNAYLPMVDPTLSLDDILADDNDGVLNGNLIEFKLRINDLNAVLFQSIKYLSALRIKGKPVPASILLIDLNAEIAYKYESAVYLDDIEQVYSGGASKGDKGFVGGNYVAKFEYSKQVDAANLIKVLKERNFTKIHIDENCIVGWATAFYRARPEARKEDFLGDDAGKHKTIGEIRNPSTFADYIYPYKGKTNIKFQYLMDKLNDTLQKKNLGAFYTPEQYAEKSYELLRKAIDRVPAGNDYVIIDRCAGTGNLEKGLTHEELSHCILSTVEYYEYKVLQELLGAKVRHIIPPVEAADTFDAGLVRGADALSREYIENPVIKQYIDNPQCTIILFENPPYAETTSIEHQKKNKGKKSTEWKSKYAVVEMKKEVNGTATNDLGNVFIWSGFKWFLRQPSDSYVVYSPVKYWKAQHLISRKFIDGFAFNRRWFHTNIDACIMVALWANEPSSQTQIALKGFDIAIDKSNTMTLAPLSNTLPVKQLFKGYSTKYFDKRTYPDDKTDAIVCGLDGIERPKTKSLAPIFNNNIIGYMAVYSSGFDNPDLHATLIRCGRYDGHGFYIRSDNYLTKLPMFCASRYITYNREWTERARIMKSADGADRFNTDVASGKLDQWLRKCLLFTCLEMQNHMRTFTGSDGRFYRNELCLDTTNGDTISSKDITMLSMNADEKKMLKQWNTLLNYAKVTAEYDSSLTYGVYQIFAEIDTSHKDNETGEKVWNNIEVHSALKTLKEQVKAYYNKEIVPMLFKYEFLK